MTTSNIPDGISFDDLKSLADNAGEQPKEQGPYNGLTREELLTQVQEASNAVESIIDHPLGHKILVLECINRMIGWHTNVGMGEIQEGDAESAKGWLRDAGKFQAVMNLLTNIGVDAHDFTTTWYQEPEA